MKTTKKVAVAILILLFARIVKNMYDWLVIERNKYKHKQIVTNEYLEKKNHYEECKKYIDVVNRNKEVRLVPKPGHERFAKTCQELLKYDGKCTTFNNENKVNYTNNNSIYEGIVDNPSSFLIRLFFEITAIVMILSYILFN